ncbi:MAG: ESX-1 secretion-associated protein [Mycobacteriaceae bacterium]|nr:ESX-1 secretion-associated protein [Mycobacteriaceae bacterium]
MADLRTNPDYIKTLAPHQTQAAAAFGSAAGAISGLAERVSTTHGVVCGVSQSALQNLEEAHNNLAKAMQEFSNQLATWLSKASDAYARTDNLAAENLHRQIN